MNIKKLCLSAIFFACNFINASSRQEGTFQTTMQKCAKINEKLDKVKKSIDTLRKEIAETIAHVEAIEKQVK